MKIPFIKPVPLPYRLLAIAALTIGGIGFGWVNGAASVQSKWDKVIALQKVQVAQIKQAQAEVTTKVVTQYVDRVKLVRERGETIIKEVPKYVSSDSCELSGGFRLFHDAAATNIIPDPARGTDAPAVPAQDLATTIAENYRQYYELSEQVTALQEWVRGQEKVDSIEKPP